MAFNVPRKTLILPVVLMVMMLGSSAAFWTTTLKLKGNITTDDFKPELSLPTDDWGDNEVLKDIGHVTADFVGPFPGTIVITIDHAYPGYEAYVGIGVHNAGSVPCIIKDISWAGAPPELQIWTSQRPGSPWPVIGYVFPYCTEIFFYLHVKVFEDDTAKPPINPLQDTTYSFTVNILLVQYNMPP